ncbi:glycosyl transferase family 2 [Altererythrobacter sp. B11]|nr:glycosyl transferase family 2 [Altererythrobacter sp. B11]
MTFALMAYNQERYILEAVEGALAQTYQPLEIIASDDCSTDGTFDILRAVSRRYRGPHKLTVQRNRVNLGIAEHVNVLFEQARGRFVVLAAGDDIAVPDRTAITVRRMLQPDRPTFVETAYEAIDQDGAVLHARKGAFPSDRSVSLKDVTEGRGRNFVGAARTYNKDALLIYPGINARCPTEDSVLLLRSLLIGDGAYLGEIGVRRRSHSNNASGPDAIARMDMPRIWAQYRADIHVAQAAGVASPAQAAEVESWITVSSLRRAFRMTTLSQRLRLSVGILLSEIKSGEMMRLIVHLMKLSFMRMGGKNARP